MKRLWLGAGMLVLVGVGIWTFGTGIDPSALTSGLKTEVVPEQISQAPDQPTVLPALYASYVALRTGVQRLCDQIAKDLVQLYSDMEGPQVRH